MRIINILIVFLLVGNISHSQISFFKQFSNQGYDYGEGIVQLEDSSYVITGSSSSFGNTSSQAFLLKIDSLGNFIWSNRYGGSEAEGGRRVLYKQNFGFFICGYTNSFGSGAYDFYLAKVDENAQFEWESSYGGSGWERVTDAALTRDTGVIMIGETSSNTTNNKDIFIVKTNSNGVAEWTRTIGGVGEDYATAINVHNDSMFVISGSLYIQDSLMSKSYLLYLKDDGSVIWEDTLDFSGESKINDFVIVNDTLKLIGQRAHVGDTDIDHLEITYSLVSQSIVSNNIYHSEGDLIGEHVTDYGSGTTLYTITSTSASWTFPVGYDLVFSRYNKNLIWLNALGNIQNPREDVAGEFIKTSDGGAISVGHSVETGVGGATIFVLKIGPDGTFPNTNVPDYDNLVGIDELAVKYNVRISPNPTNGLITVSTEIQDEVKIEVYSIAGEKIYTTSGKDVFTVDLSNYSKGMYYVYLSSKGVSLGVKKIIKR